jgi:hypothetical protein
MGRRRGRAGWVVHTVKAARELPGDRGTVDSGGPRADGHEYALFRETLVMATDSMASTCYQSSGDSYSYGSIFELDIQSSKPPASLDARPLDFACLL